MMELLNVKSVIYNASRVQVLLIIAIIVVILLDTCLLPVYVKMGISI